MGAAYRPGAEGAELHYYVCRARLDRQACDASYVRVGEADAAVDALLLEQLTKLRAELAAGAAPEAAAASTTDAELERIAKRRARLLDMAAEGVLSTDDLKRRLAKADDEVARVTLRRRSEHAEERARRPGVRREVLGQLDALAKAWGKAPVARRRVVLNLLASEVRIAKGAAPTITWRSVAEMLKDK